MRAIREDIVKREDFQRLQLAHNVTNMELDIVKQRYKDASDSIIAIKHETVAIRDLINEKATNKYIHETFAEKKQLFQVQDMFNDYLKKKEFESLLEDFENYKVDVETSYYKKFTIDKKFIDIKTECAEKYATIPDLNFLKAEIKKTNEVIKEENKNIRADIRKNNTDIDKLKKDIVEVHKILKTKTTATETDSIKDQIKLCALQVDFKALEKSVVPPVAQMRDEINSFCVELKKHQQMIRRFDEIICEKASKTSIQEVYNDLLSYVKKIDYNEENKAFKRQMENHNVEFERMKSTMDELNNKISIEINSAVKKIVKHETNKIMGLVKSMSPTTKNDRDTEEIK